MAEKGYPDHKFDRVASLTVDDVFKIGTTTVAAPVPQVFAAVPSAQSIVDKLLLAFPGVFTQAP